MGREAEGLSTQYFFPSRGTTQIKLPNTCRICCSDQKVGVYLSPWWAMEPRTAPAADRCPAGSVSRNFSPKHLAPDSLSGPAEWVLLTCRCSQRPPCDYFLSGKVTSIVSAYLFISSKWAFYFQFWSKVRKEAFWLYPPKVLDYIPWRRTADFWRFNPF